MFLVPVFLEEGKEGSTMKVIIIQALLLFILNPVAVFSEETVPHAGFIAITETALDTLNTLEGEARKDNFNQLQNPALQKKFEKISSTLDEYEDYSANPVYSWPEGQQKKIASELHAANFLYRAYSMSQYDKFRQDGEKSLKIVRDNYHDYLNAMKSGKKLYIDK